MKLSCLSLCLFLVTFQCAASFVALHRVQQPLRTALRVSELHIPGYATTKLPFILSDRDDNNAASIPLQKRSYKAEDYESRIPFQDGHLLHKTRQPIFTPDECNRIVAEAEQRALEIHGRLIDTGIIATT
jgi:hypothetical protein